MEKILRLQNHTLYVYDFEVIDSRTYMIREDDELLLIDPCVSGALAERIRGARHALVYLTHEHFDHISGVNWIRDKVECEVWCTECCAGRLQDPRLNMSRTFPLLFLQEREKFQYVREHTDREYSCKADKTFATEKKMAWKGHSLYMRKTSGHSPGGSMLLLDEEILFAGDSLLGNGLELKSLGADEEAYKAQVLAYVCGMSPEMQVCPGHGEVRTLGDILGDITRYI